MEMFKDISRLPGIDEEEARMLIEQEKFMD
jgi:hypothetical protein